MVYLFLKELIQERNSSLATSRPPKPKARAIATAMPPKSKPNAKFTILGATPISVNANAPTKITIATRAAWAKVFACPAPELAMRLKARLAKYRPIPNMIDGN